MRQRRTLAYASICLAGLGVACSPSSTQSIPDRFTPAAPPAMTVPSYRLEVGEKPSTLDVFVDKTPTSAEAAQIVGDLQGKYAGKDDAYFVTINCSKGGTRDVDNRLANGKFAVGSIGAARTGLDDGAREVSLVEGNKCPPDPLPIGSPEAVTAQQVVDAVIAAGLPATDPRDNSASNCGSSGCVQLITTDDFSTYQFPDPASAQKWGASFADSGYVNGTIFLRFNRGGSDPTDPAAIPQYKAVLDSLMR
jgi:hypothetical protein